jgi:hypothetical protein
MAPADNRQRRLETRASRRLGIGQDLAGAEAVAR